VHNKPLVRRKTPTLVTSLLVLLCNAMPVRALRARVVDAMVLARMLHREL
jgi:hypothetical protein